MAKKTKTTNPEEIKLRQYEKKYEALLANREKFEDEIEKIDEQLVELGEKIETLKGKLRGAISLSFSWNTVLLIILIILVGGFLLFGGKGRREYMPQPAAVPTSFLQSIPGPGGNVRCAQPNAGQLASALGTGRYKVCLRLNGDGTDRERGALSHQEEQEICEQYGAEFVYLNIDQYEPDSYAYERVLDEAQRLLELGQVITHCRNNMHRNGTVVGRYLRSMGYSEDAIIAHNNWQDLATDPGKYARYVNAVFN